MCGLFKVSIKFNGGLKERSAPKSGLNPSEKVLPSHCDLNPEIRVIWSHKTAGLSHDVAHLYIQPSGRRTLILGVSHLSSGSKNPA